MTTMQPGPSSPGGRFWPRVAPFTRPGETLELVAPVVCVATASGVKIPGAAGAAAAAGGAAGNRLGRMGAVRGGPDGIARSIPYQPNVTLGIFDHRVGLYTISAKDRPAELWTAPRAVLARVERRPRLQMLRRIRLHFSDGSSAALMVPSRAIIDQLAAAVDRYPRGQ